jgi:PAS domain-containing protein
MNQMIFENPDVADDRWLAFFGNACVGIIITDARGRFVVANAAFEYGATFHFALPVPG